MMKTLKITINNMRCCAPFCKTTAETVSGSAGVTFHKFPSDPLLRAAWLRALGRQDARLPDPAVVCSQHFLDDDMYETEFGSRQIRAGAIPATVQVCMICLNSYSKLFLLSKHKLEEAYKHLTGNPPCDVGNLKQAICVHCAQRLRNFSRFRDKSLRARELMTDLVQQHELITRLHIKKINRAKHRLKSNLVVTTFSPDYFDLHILEDLQEEDTIDPDAVKMETNNSETEDMEVTNEDEHADDVRDDDFVEGYSSDHSIKLEAQIMDDGLLEALNRKAVSTQVAVTQDMLKSETTPFKCTLCFEEFVHQHAYLQHLSMHRQAKEVENSQGNTSPEPNIPEVEQGLLSAVEITVSLVPDYSSDTMSENENADEKDYTRLSGLASKNLSPLLKPIKRSPPSSLSSSRSSSAGAAPNSISSSSSSSDSNSMKPKHVTGLIDASKCVEKQKSLPNSPNERVTELRLNEGRSNKNANHNIDQSEIYLSDGDHTIDFNKALNKTNTNKNLFEQSNSSECSTEQNQRRGRKRSRNISKWQQQRSKRLRNKGESYVSISSKTRKTVPARSIKDTCTEKCRLKCAKNIDDEGRYKLFSEFWDLGDLISQRAYIRTCMMDVTPKYKYTNSAGRSANFYRNH